MAEKDTKNEKELEEAEEAPEDGEDDLDEEEGSKESKPKKSKKKLILLIALVLLLSIGGGVVFYLREQQLDKEKKHQEELNKAKHEVIFYDLEPMIINLKTQNSKTESYLKIQVTLELKGEKNLDAVKKFTPKIKDSLLFYLRELTPEDMQGSMALYRLQDELLLRINKIISPGHVEDILFKDLFIQ